MDERQWIREIQRGKTEYLQAIAEKYYDDIYRFCCYQTGNGTDAYDLAQDTFLRFIKYVENYRYRNMKGYLLTIAMNVCRDYFSAKKNRALYEDIGEEQMEERAGDMDKNQSMEETPEVLVEKAQIQTILLNALGKLPSIQREAIILHYCYGMKHREIARLTGVGVATVKSRVQQGITKLKGMLRKEDFYENG